VVEGAGVLVNLLKGKRATFILSDFSTSKLLEDLVQNHPDTRYRKTDKLWRLVDKATSENVEPFELACVLVERLHLMGAIGVKFDPNLAYQYFFQTQKPLPTSYLSLETKLRVHPMIHSALGIIN